MKFFVGRVALGCWLIGALAGSCADEAASLKDLKGFFPLEVPASRSGWEERAALVKQRLLVANGLYPMPTKTPLRPAFTGTIKRPGFVVEKVYFESVPGFYVTGLLFRPDEGAGGEKKHPAVLSPHGHGGRLQDFGEEGVLREIKNGGERFADSGRFPKVARCATLARLGCVVLLYDMIGYADSQQISREVAHRLRGPRPSMEGPEAWGFFSVHAELRLQSIFGLQTWNSIRALDFLCSLPYVDDRKIGVTGGSGGGTQTMMVCALDPRPTVSFPNGMVSSSMQGGCPCENACLLRINTGNVEFAALFAPRPMGMTAADDWTREMLVPGKGFFEIQKIYALYGKEEEVMCADLLRFKHNYNVVTRELMYGWFNRYLELGHEEPVEETDFPSLTLEEHEVYGGKHPRPEGGDDFERKLTSWLDNDSTAQLASLTKEERGALVSRAWETILGVYDDPPPMRVRGEIVECGVQGICLVIPRDEARPEETPVVENPRLIPAYTHGYNHSYFAHRARTAFGTLRYLAEEKGRKGIHLRAEGMEESAVALAVAVVAKQGWVESVELSAEGRSFRFGGIDGFRHPEFVPGAVK
ncbi:MAG: hypothetical protein AAGJ31_09925, partial [Verrucomicrobiota bacterium]